MHVVSYLEPPTRACQVSCVSSYLSPSLSLCSCPSYTSPSPLLSSSLPCYLSPLVRVHAVEPTAQAYIHYIHLTESTITEWIMCMCMCMCMASWLGRGVCAYPFHPQPHHTTAHHTAPPRICRCRCLRSCITSTTSAVTSTTPQQGLDMLTWRETANVSSSPLP